ncbi:class I SAM-dependent methyltransferase [Nonomuraea sp. NPDC050536]|uniref:class I SAM-dependent methyltransferase n=1 Tax=Nonomuraea sp. NPDC050536 TaxID=3364366 RepID=UPI0037C71F75
MSGEVRPASVKLTSDWMAVIRAREHAQPDAYLHDPCAAAFVTPASEAALDVIQAAGLPSPIVPIRGRLGDITLLESGLKQVVCLGAGTDARPYRLPVPPDLAYFEVDLPGQLDGKTELLKAAGFQARCEVRVVEADLRAGWTDALLAAGYSPAEPAHWIAEGLFYYLTPAEGTALLSAISELAAQGSWLTFDGPHVRFLTDPAKAGFHHQMRERGAPFVGSFTDPVELLAPHGWSAQAVVHRDLAACAWLPKPPARLLNPGLDLWLARAHRR